MLHTHLGLRPDDIEKLEWDKYNFFLFLLEAQAEKEEQDRLAAERDMRRRGR